MNTNAKLCEPSLVKEVLCKHFNTQSDRAHLTIREKQFAGLGGPQVHYYHFTLADRNAKHRVFGKISPSNEREYRALQYLMKTVSEEQKDIARPIALLKNGTHSLLLLEYLDGYSDPFSIAHALRLIPNRTLNVTKVGRAILEKIYGLQQQYHTIYSPLSTADTDEVPGQPRPIAVAKQLESIKSLSRETKALLQSRINAIVDKRIPIRRGVVHGQMGLRNIMIRRSHIAFIDWEYMQTEGLCIYDACYIVIMLLMRSVELLITRSELAKISDFLFEHIRYLEDRLTEPGKKQFVRDGLSFAKRLGMIDTLWQYETGRRSGLKALLRQRERKIRYLAYAIEKDAENVG
jgi:hypothetical protein